MLDIDAKRAIFCASSTPDQSFFKRSKRFKRFKRFKRKNVDDEGNRKKYKNTEKQHENGKYDKWVVLIKPHNGCDAFRILIRNCK